MKGSPILHNAMLKDASYYARMGLAVLPVHSIRDGRCSCGQHDCPSPGKHPRTADGVKSATKEIQQITEWWTKWPDANIGIATGSISGIVAIDVDCDHNAGKYGDESLREWQDENGQFPETWQSLTGGGGQHYIFRCDDPALKNRTGVLQGIDIKANRGYIVAPPSLHRSGRRYAWECSSGPEDIPLALLPDKLRDLIRGNARETRTPIDIPEVIPKGTRNDTLFRLASSLRARGLSESELLAALLAVNEERCIPPLSAEEVRSIVKSVSRYPQGTAVVKSGTLEVLTEDYSDIGNARLFVELNREQLYHVYSWGWMAWNGMQWVRNADWAALDAAIKMADRLLESSMAKMQEAAAITGEEGRTAQEKAKKVYNHACRSRQERQLRAAVSLAKPGLHEEAESFDKSPYDLNTPAGIVDLRTGLLRKHEPNAMCTMITAIAPDDIPAPMFTKFLDTVTCGNTELQGYLQQVAGMAAVGRVFVEGVVICHGRGRNGKSTFLNLLMRVLGDYACCISPEILMSQRSGHQPQGIAAIRGKRLVISQETEEGKQLSVSTLKQLSSTDKIVAKRLYRDPEEFTPTHTLILATNFLPKVGSIDIGTSRRLFIVPFLHTFSDADVQTDYLDVVYSLEAPAVLRWIIEGAKQFIQNGHKIEVPQIVRVASKDYADSENWVNRFIEECCETAPEYRERGSKLYDAYRAWAEKQGESVRRARDFAAALETTGFTKVRTKTGAEWQGLRVKDMDGFDRVTDNDG